jgi:hypothetical protein
MTRETFEAACFLCDSASQYYQFDGDKRRHYRCTAAACGEYVVTDSARRWLDKDHAKSWRRKVGELAGKVSNESKILEIWVNPETKTLETHLVDR